MDKFCGIELNGVIKIKGKRTLILLLCGTVLAVSVTAYIGYHKNNKPTTICKAPTPKNTNTTDKGSSPNGTITKNPDESKPAAVSETDKPKSADVNTVGNRNSNIINSGMAAEQGKWVYFNCNGLCKAMIDMKTGWKRLNWDNASNINVIGEWIYYTNGATLYKMKIDGTEKTELYSGMIFNVIATPQWIFYLDMKDCCLYRIDINNKNVTKLTTSWRFDFSIIDDWIYFYEDISGAEPQYFKMHFDGSSKTPCSQQVPNLNLDPNNIKSFNYSKDYLYYITNDFMLYRAKGDNYKFENPTLLCDLSRYKGDANSLATVLDAKPLITVLNNFLLIHWNDAIYKVDFNGNIEKVND